MSQTAARFPPTCWTTIIQLQEADEAERGAVLEGICATYWPPLYAYARMRGLSREDAEDATQDFLSRLLRGAALDEIRPSGAKLRSWFLTAFQRHLANVHRDATRQKRGGNQVDLRIDADEIETQLASETSNASPEAAYDRSWALALLAHTLGQLKAKYDERSKSEIFETLKPFLDIEGDPVSHQEAADKLGMNAGSVRTAVHRLRREFQTAIRREIADTLSPDADVEAELQHLLATFG